jgi:hypothetical protein
MTDTFPLILIGYGIIMAICLWFIYDAFWANSKLIILGIGGSALLFYLLHHLLCPVYIPEDFATTFIGADFSLNFILYATPSVLVLGIAGMIDSIKWKIKEKRSK